MMSELNPRHSVKARRKQKEETVGDLAGIDTTAAAVYNHNDANSFVDDDNRQNNIAANNELDASWRSKYEAAVRKRRSPIAVGTNIHHNSQGAASNNGSDWGRRSNLSPMSNKSSAVNSITSMSQADMEFILATSMDTHDQTNDTNGEMLDPQVLDGSPTSNYSADSIIRRVEAEIAAARKSAAMAKHNRYYNNNSNQQMNANNRNEDDDDDMAQILNTTNTFSDHHPTMDNNGATSPSIASSADSSKRRAMDLIHDEFRNDVHDSPTKEVVVIESNQTAFPTETWNNVGTGTSNSFLMNLRQTTKNLVKNEENMFHPHEEKKEELATEFGTPTRTNGRRSVKDPDATNTGGGVLSNTTIDPDGEYQETSTPPRQPSTSNCDDPSAMKGTASSNNNNKPFPPLSPTLASRQLQNPRRPSPMDKTRELLDSLKEQRQSLQKSPSPSNSNNTPSLGVVVDSIGDDRSSRTFPQHNVFPEEVYELVKETSDKSNASTDQSRRIRFRNPFPLLKPPTVHRSLDEMIHDHAMDLPDVPVRWVKPKQELKQLIVAAMGTSLPRRSNACGALKVLTRQEKNQMSLVRTDGFLQAITYAASQSVLDVDTDLAIDARTRAVTCFKNVCHPKENRVLILSHPGVIECLLKVVQNDDGAGRSTAAAAIALLAKTPQCRECLVHIEGLIDTLAKVMHSAGTMISEEAQAVRSMSPRSGGSNTSFIQNQVNRTISNTKDENTVPIDSSINHNGDAQEKSPTFRNEATDSIVTESSSLSSGEGDGDAKPHHESPTKTGVDVITIGSKLYDVRSVDSIRNQTEERYEEFVNQARCNACAALLHISKQCATSYDLATNYTFLSCVAAVAREVDHPIHTKCLEILCNLTRLPANNLILTKFDGIIETLIVSSNSTNPTDRLSALHSLQNMSSDAGSKTLLATSAVLNLLTSCAMRKDTEEKDIAVATLYNITTEPGAVTAITNTKNVVATLVHLAHSPDSSSDVRLLACEALATISLWLQTLAGTGKVPEGVVNVPLPSQKTTGWERWD